MKNTQTTYVLQHISEDKYYARKGDGFTTPHLCHARHYLSEQTARAALSSLNEFWRAVPVKMEVM